MLNNEKEVQNRASS